MESIAKHFGLSGPVVGYSAHVTRALGGDESSSLMAHQIWFWTAGGTKTTCQTAEAVEWAVGISERKQKRARQVLVAKGWLVEDLVRTRGKSRLVWTMNVAALGADLMKQAAADKATIAARSVTRSATRNVTREVEVGVRNVPLQDLRSKDPIQYKTSGADAPVCEWSIEREMLEVFGDAPAAHKPDPRPLEPKRQAEPNPIQPLLVADERSGAAPAADPGLDAVTAAQVASGALDAAIRAAPTGPVAEAAVRALQAAWAERWQPRGESHGAKNRRAWSGWLKAKRSASVLARAVIGMGFDEWEGRARATTWDYAVRGEEKFLGLYERHVVQGEAAPATSAKSRAIPGHKLVDGYWFPEAFSLTQLDRDKIACGDQHLIIFDGSLDWLTPAYDRNGRIAAQDAHYGRPVNHPPRRSGGDL